MPLTFAGDESEMRIKQIFRLVGTDLDGIYANVNWQDRQSVRKALTTASEQHLFIGAALLRCHGDDATGLVEVGLVSAGFGAFSSRSRTTPASLCPSTGSDSFFWRRGRSTTTTVGS